jgi:hypothetical protein
VPTNEAKFCPKCGSAYVDYSALTGGKAACNLEGCGWSGSSEELLAAPFTAPEGGSTDEIFNAFVHDVKDVLARGVGTELARLLLRWGFIMSHDPKEQRKQLAQYLEAMAQGAVARVIHTRVQLEKEGK